jgi:hypothetical protein
MTKWLGMAGEVLPEGWEWKLRGVVDSLRLSPFRLNYWTPPGLLDTVKPPRKDVLGKVVSDSMEAIIGVFYEALGPAKNNCWLACLGLIPGAPTVRTACCRRACFPDVTRCTYAARVSAHTHSCAARAAAHLKSTWPSVCSQVQQSTPTAMGSGFSARHVLSGRACALCYVCVRQLSCW